MSRLHLVLRWGDPPAPAPVPAGVAVRVLAAADAEPLALLFFRAYRGDGEDEYATLGDARTEVDETLAGHWGELFRPGSLAAWSGVELVAATITVFDAAHDRQPLLAFVVTDPGWRRRGLAAALIGSSIAALDARDVRALHLAVLPDNPARSLYERLGFTLVPEGSHP